MKVVRREVRDRHLFSDEAKANAFERYRAFSKGDLWFTTQHFCYSQTHGAQGTNMKETAISICNFEISTYFRRSSADLILFLHGLGCSKDSFLSAFNEPSLKSFSLLAPDCVGFGNSAKPKAWDYTVEAHASLLAELIKAFDYTRLHIVAHSFGGAVALLLPPQVLEGLAAVTSRRLTGFGNH